VALGEGPAHFASTQLDSVAATLTSPWAGGAVPPEVLQRGGVIFQTQCSACHGPAGAGTGPVVGPGKFPFAPPINGAATAARSDGYIYAVIAAGRGLMPPYGEKVAHMDRWAVVAYVRELERAGGAAPATVPAAAPATGAAATGAAAAPAGDSAAAVAP
jgi:mono/diheme cytochrome c family protein